MTTTQVYKAVWGTDRLDERQADVQLAGGGIAVDLLAAILARGGLRVTVVPGDGSDPVGVNTVPYTAELLYLLADRFRVPEIADLAMYGRLPASLQASSGTKKSLGFVYHRPNSAHDQRENVQFSVPDEHAEWHAYLPAVRKHTRSIAERYGAQYLGAAEATDRPARLVLNCSGSGPGVNATAYFEGIRRFEDLRPPKDGGYTQPWSEGSTAHVFRAGWVHIASFDNHPEAQTRGAVLTLRLSARHPDAGGELDEVLARLGRRYPDLGLLLAGATRTGRWTGSLGKPGVSADALRLPGEATLALDLQHGEALFGQNLTMALELVHAAAATLLRPGALAGTAAIDDTVRTIGEFQRKLLCDNEWFAEAGLLATTDFCTWNAFVRAWLLWSISAALALKKVRIDAARSRDWRPASKFADGVDWFDLAPGIADTVVGAAQVMRQLHLPGMIAPVVAQRVFRLLSRRRIIPPLYQFGRPEARRYRLNLPTRLKLLAWTFTLAPKAYRGMLTADNITAVPDQEAELKR